MGACLAGKIAPVGNGRIDLNMRPRFDLCRNYRNLTGGTPKRTAYFGNQSGRTRKILFQRIQQSIKNPGSFRGID